jgi:hypothetical protein
MKIPGKNGVVEVRCISGRKTSPVEAAAGASTLTPAARVGKSTSESSAAKVFKLPMMEKQFQEELQVFKKYMKDNGGKVAAPLGNSYIREHLKVVDQAMHLMSSSANDLYLIFQKYPHLGVRYVAPIDPTSSKARDRLPHYALREVVENVLQVCRMLQNACYLWLDTYTSPMHTT